MQKKIHLIFLLMLVASGAFCNIAQPGLRDAGGSLGIRLLFPEDSAALKLIQMQRERVSIQLYKGYAVVKGEYWMQNSSDDTIRIKTAYPLNANFSSFKSPSHLTEINFGELYGLEVFVNQQAVSIEQKSMPIFYPGIQSFADESGTEQWYVWDTPFSPQTITPIVVYFLVNTNESSILQGYDTEHPNGFIYVLETAASWKLPIEEGDIRIQLMDGLQLEDLRGGSPDTIFSYEPQQKVLRYSFQDLYPDHENNIILTYGQRQETFDFGQILSQKAALFNQADQLSQLQFDDQLFQPMLLGSPFELSSRIGSHTVSFLFYLIIYGPVLLGALLLYFIVRWLLRRFRRPSPKLPKS